MGNQDGVLTAMSSIGTNEMVRFEEGHFSFAFGNEIALVLDNKFYILNCNKKLFDEVKKFLKTKRTLEEIKIFWCDKSLTHEVSDWSNNFEDIK